MRWGFYISGAGHAALILFVLFGGLFAGDRIPEVVTLSEVSILSEEEYAALVPPGTAPETQTDAPDVTVPDEDTAPETPTEDAAPALSEPEPIDVPDTPQPPELEETQPIPDAVVVDTAPPVPAAPSEQDGTSFEPDAVAAPAPRVAPVPQVATPETETGPELIEDTAPDPEAPPEDPVEEETPTAPEEASDRIVTEAEEVETYAPASSRRPRARPPKPVRRAAEDPETPSNSTDDAVAAALAEDEPAEQPIRRGPPLTGSEKDAFRLAVSQCWNVGSLSTEALGTTVVVGFEMEQSGTPVTGSIRMVSFSGGSDAGARQAFEAARRAIIRCGARGFGLPVEKYDQWREIEATFNPEGMQFR
ncbi:MAG: energy transducer TonB [Silicimonas sp.]|nr:energy transducer TonB [Silicimonas sp.]